MKLSLEQEALALYVEKQLCSFFPDSVSPGSVIVKSLDRVLERIAACFSAVKSKYFQINDQACFNHLNGDHYAMFLYFLANTLYRMEENTEICEKVFYLNRILHGIDVFYSVELPDIFLFCHPLGTVLGRAKYSNYLLVYQGCTVGASHEAGNNKSNEYPVLGKYLALYMGASILGKCTIGENCKISANSSIMDKNLNDNSIYIGTPTKHVIKHNSHADAIWSDQFPE